MQEFRSWYILQISERLRETDDIVPIDGSEIAKMKGFKEVAVLHEDSLESLFGVFEKFFCHISEFADFAKQITDFITDKIERMRGSDFCKIIS